MSVSHWFSLLGPAINLSLLQTTTFRCGLPVRPACELGSVTLPKATGDPGRPPPSVVERTCHRPPPPQHRPPQTQSLPWALASSPLGPASGWERSGRGALPNSRAAAEVPGRFLLLRALRRLSPFNCGSPFRPGPRDEAGKSKEIKTTGNSEGSGGSLAVSRLLRPSGPLQARWTPPSRTSASETILQ